MKIVIDTGQDGTIINARVRQKAATEAEWLSKDPEILDGEAAFVRRADGAPVNFKLGDGNKKFSELPYFVTGDAGEFINVMGSELPVSGPNFPDKGYAVVGPGTYTQSGGPDVVVPSGHMGILNWDGSVWYLGSSVEMPDNSAKIAEWEAGTYDKDEVVTVEGVIYRATEQTNEEPPSDKWEVIGGASSDLEVSNSLVYNPSEIHIPSSQWIAGQSFNTSGNITNDPSVSRTGKILLKKGLKVEGAIQSEVGRTLYAYVLNLDGTIKDMVARDSSDGVEFSYVADSDCLVEITSLNNVGGSYHVTVQSETVDDLTYCVRTRLTGESMTKGFRFSNSGADVNDSSWALSDYVFGKEGSRVFGDAGKAGDTTKLVKFNIDRTVVEVLSTDGGKFDFESDGDYLYRMASEVSSLDYAFIQVNEVGTVLRGVELGDDKFGFGAKGLIPAYSHNLTYDSTNRLKVNVGDKLTAEIYALNTPARPFFRFSDSNLFLTNALDAPVTPQELSKVIYPQVGYDTYVYITTRNDFGAGYNYKIERAIVHALRQQNAPYREGYPYVGGDVVEYRGYLFRARELTFSPPTNADDWDSIVGNSPVPKSNHILIDIPNSLGVLNINGPMPLDAGSTRSKSLAEAVLNVNGEDKLWFKTRVSIQGSSSAAHAKKGYAIDLLGFDNEKLKLSFDGGELMGDPVTWTTTDGFHLKAFHQDELMTRDVACMRLWRLFFLHMPYPSNWFSNPAIPDDNSTVQELYGDRARFITDGFPVVLRYNGEYRGLYVWRQKKERSNYRLEKDNKKHIWLEASGSTSMVGFDASKWELRNPKLPNYSEGDAIDDPEVMTDINRFFDWMQGVFDGSIDFDATHEDYIDINTFVYYLVFSELIYGTDGYQKNFQLFTYGDGIWKINPYDLDLTLGYEFNRVFVHPSNIRSDSNRMLKYLLDNKLDLIKGLYKQLKADKIINTTTIFNVFRQIPAQIGSEELENNFQLWGSVPYSRDGHRTSLHWIMDYFQHRIEYLDSIWDND